MWKLAVLLICLSGYCSAGPVGQKRNMAIVQQRNEHTSISETESTANVDPNEIISSLSLPSNATSIRADITDGFSCENKTYGYYADVDNDCQIFHVCLPVVYADGKENTFRWSFICPEDTIFSQDSFTCMRPDDMRISCEESYQYYELNRNFGILESASTDNENDNEAASSPTENNETVSESQVEPEVIKPIVHDEEKFIGQSKPVNVLKPSRRKPSISYATQKKPTNSYPLRKIPQTQSFSHNIGFPTTQALEDEQTLEELTIKPTVYKFSRRPVPATNNLFNDKSQTAKTESQLPTRTELFNQVRKRPSLFHKKPAQPEEEQVKIEIGQEQHNFSPMESDMSISNSKTQVADTELEASESNQVFLKPEEDNNAVAEPAQILEAFEEIPAVISEVVNTPNAPEEETNNKETAIVLNATTNIAEEPQITEEVQSAEDIQTDNESSTSEKVQPLQETQNSSFKTQASEETQNIVETENANKVTTAQELPESQENPEISGEEVQTLDESKITNKNVENAEQFHISQATQNVADFEETRMGEQDEIPEETDTAGNTLTAKESYAVKESLSAEYPETAEEIQAAEEHIPEDQNNIQTSSEEIQNSDNMLSEENPMTQDVEEVLTPEQTEIKNEFPIAALQGLGNVPNKEKIEQTGVVQEVQNYEDSKENYNFPDLQKQQPESTRAEETLEVEEPHPVTYKVEDLKENYHASDLQTDEREESTHDEESLLEVEEPQPVAYKEENLKENYHIPDAQIQEEEKSIQTEETSDVEETQPIDSKVKDSELYEKPESVENSKTVVDSFKAEPGLATKESEIVAENDISPQTIEQMESEKPAEAPESMQATDDMSQSDTMVQEMYENMDVNKKGGFKPVDPIMAHEAEQLIVDFINTLRKNDFTNETPGMHMEHQIDEVSQEEKTQNNENEVQETEEVDTKFEDQIDETGAEVSETKDHTIEHNNDGTQDVAEDEESNQKIDAAVEETNEENALKSLESQSIENVEESKKSGEASEEAMSLSQEMYQIPVKVITAPVEETLMKEEQSYESKIESTETSAITEEKTQEKSTILPIAGNKPLSIDDIVELVKERLDNMPHNEMETPMQLEQVLEEAQEVNAPKEKVEEQSPVSTEQQQHTSVSEEEVVMPIYQRTVQPIIAQVEAVVQTDNLEQVQNAEQPEIADSVTDVKEKTNRSYRSRSMLTPKLDPRKRHFLFKSDSR